MLAGVFAGLVLLATAVLPFKAPVAVAASTLVAAALFNPLRSGSSTLSTAGSTGPVRRRPDRGRFAARLKDAADLNSVRADLAAVVRKSPGTRAHLSMDERTRRNRLRRPRALPQPPGRRSRIMESATWRAYALLQVEGGQRRVAGPQADRTADSG